MNELFDDRLNVLVYALAWSLLHFLWQGAALASAFGLAMIAARQCSARTRYVIGCATLAAMVLAPAVTLTWLLNKPTAASASPPSTLGVSAAALERTAMAPSGVNPAMLITVILWALGAAACTLWLFGGWAHARRLRRLPDRGLPARCRDVVDRISAAMRVWASVRLVESAAVSVPMTMGWLAPVILLPASLLTGLPAKQLEAIIAHEFAHIRRFDYLVNLLQTMIESLLFYHPAVWWVSRRVRLEREYCCDDLAVMVCGDRVLYARALTELETLRGVSARVRLGLSSNGGSLMKRIVRLIDHDGSRPAAPAKLPATLAACALFASASAAFAFMNPQPAAAQEHQPAAAEMLLEPTAQVDAKAAYIERSLRLWDIQRAQAEVEATGEVWHLMNAVAQQVERASTEFDTVVRPALYQRARFLDTNAQDEGEMPSEGLVKAAQLLYPFNVFTWMPWISPEAHQLIRPSEGDSNSSTRLESFTMTQPGQWVAVVKEPSAHTEIHWEQSDNGQTNFWAQSVSLGMTFARPDFTMPNIERPALRIVFSVEMSQQDEADAATVDDGEIVDDEAGEVFEEQHEPGLLLFWRVWEPTAS
jgi:beta-lactamase regulating signal transducer with metallopeptidase domain